MFFLKLVLNSGFYDGSKKVYKTPPSLPYLGSRKILSRKILRRIILRQKILRSKKIPVHTEKVGKKTTSFILSNKSTFMA
jgi:hypothetical protein